MMKRKKNYFIYEYIIFVCSVLPNLFSLINATHWPTNDCRTGVAFIVCLCVQMILLLLFAANAWLAISAIDRWCCTHLHIHAHLHSMFQYYDIKYICTNSRALYRFHMNIFIYCIYVGYIYTICICVLCDMKSYTSQL